MFRIGAKEAVSAKEEGKELQGTDDRNVFTLSLDELLCSYQAQQNYKKSI